MDVFWQINGKIYKITENYKIRKIRELPASLTWRSLTGSAVLWTADFLVVPREYGKGWLAAGGGCLRLGDGSHLLILCSDAAAPDKVADQVNEALLIGASIRLDGFQHI